jgi:hypothetical protein
MTDLKNDIESIIYYDDFPNTFGVDNIEFAAGKGCFGKIEFPTCFLTDISHYEVSHYTLLDTVEIGACHFLDGLADYYNYDFKGRKFKKLIFCNPFGFGLHQKFEGIRFIQRAGELLEDVGEIFLLGQMANPFVKKKNVEKRIGEYNKENDEDKWIIERELDSSELEEINSKHTFYTSTGITIKPNIGYIIKRCS